MEIAVIDSTSDAVDEEAGHGDLKAKHEVAGVEYR